MKNRFPWNGLRHLGDSGNDGTTLEFLSPFLWRPPPLEMRWERREFFPDHAGKGSLLSSLEAETGLIWMWAGLSCFLSSGDGYVGNFLSCSKGVKDPLEVPEVRCDKPRDASAEMGLISPGGENLLDFLELRQMLATDDGDLRDPLYGLRKGQSPCEFSGASRDSSPVDAGA